MIEIKKKDLAIPPELTFVPINFDRDDLFNVLDRAGYLEGGKSLFPWEGVSMYRSAEAVDSRLA